MSENSVVIYDQSLANVLLLYELVVKFDFTHWEQNDSVW